MPELFKAIETELGVVLTSGGDGDWKIKILQMLKLLLSSV